MNPDDLEWNRRVSREKIQRSITRCFSVASIVLLMIAAIIFWNFLLTQGRCTLRH